MICIRGPIMVPRWLKLGLGQSSQCRKISKVFLLAGKISRYCKSSRFYISAIIILLSILFKNINSKFRHVDVDWLFTFEWPNKGREWTTGTVFRIAGSHFPNLGVKPNPDLKLGHQNIFLYVDKLDEGWSQIQIWVWIFIQGSIYCPNWWPGAILVISWTRYCRGRKCQISTIAQKSTRIKWVSALGRIFSCYEDKGLI